MAIYGTLGENNLTALSASISDTAVDVFVYDTRKDSDGGAWRKRTSHTSWYNETLNTATRGSRREFPAVAVIVAEATQVTIYDGDDPDLPMWMVFDNNTGNIIRYGGLRSVKCLNGRLTVVQNISLGGLSIIDFIIDAGEHHNTTDGYIRKTVGGIISRNSGNNTSTDGSSLLGYPSGQFAGKTNFNDVAMTVLPNAPIDDATSLPVPTIAVATDGGASVIRDDGQVFDLTFSGQNGSKVWKITFDDKHQVCMLLGYSNVYPYTSYIYQVPSSDTALSAVTDRVLNNNTYNFPSDAYGAQNTSSGDINAYIDSKYFGTDKGMSFLTPNKNDIGGQLICHINTEFNSGWQHGDIKGAFLSDTDATNVTGSELVTNGTFDSDISGWTDNSGSGSSISWSSGTIYLDGYTNYARADQQITTVAGKTYTLSADISGVGLNHHMQLWAGTAVNTSNLGYLQTVNSYNGPVSFSFTATSTTTWIRLFTGWGNYVDNVSVRIADPDRSVNNNGLQVFGTITKQPVAGSGATAAELVAYSGFSASNHLAQPYNSDLNPGSGSYSVVAWFKTESNNSGVGAITGLGNSDTDEVMIVYVASNYGIYFDYGSGSEYVYLSDSGDRSMVRDGNWHQVVCQVTAGQVGEIYIDGIKKSTAQNVKAPSTWSQWDTNYQLYIGCGRGLGNLPFSGSISLVRYSLSKMSAEQIKKIYEDEKVLFQENAACTLYGSSDAVTALAYDDSSNILYAGTSSGRSDFQGLRRINNTTTAVTTAMSASNGLVAEQ